MTMPRTLLGTTIALAVGCSAPPTRPAAPASPPPPPIDLPAGVLAPHGTLLLGDMHGTREIPAFVGRVVTQVAAREPVVLALEIPTDNAPAIAAYMASDGSAAARRALVATAWWQETMQDGRRSIAMAALIETARALRAAGRTLDVVAFDPGALDAPVREAGMARNVIAARRAHPDAALIVFVGNAHVSKHARFQPGFRWMAMQLGEAGIPLVSLDPRWSDGTAWICHDGTAAHCGVSVIRGRPVADGIQLAPAPDAPVDGWFGVGTTIASPPAGFPALADALDAKIAAAHASFALHAQAMQAYKAQQYSQCADLLAQITNPDAEVAYAQACCLARAGRKDEAFARLRFVVDSRYPGTARMADDDDLASLHDDPRWPITK